MSKKKVLIIGAGNIGVAIAHLLPKKSFHVMIGDTDPEKMQNPLLKDFDRVGLIPFSVGEEAYLSLEGAMEDNDYVINAGPHYINEYVLICDIEGAEAGLLINDKSSLEKCKLMIIELHETKYGGKTVTISDMIMLAKNANFRLIDSHAHVFVFKK